MILYLDTSALVKLYIEENHSAVVLNAAEAADGLASHAIAYVETLTTFARLLRESRLSGQDHAMLKQRFEAHWQDFLQMSLSASLLRRAATLAEAFSLRAYDSVHLAAADMLQKQTRQQVVFACFDQRLNQSARVLGLELLAV